jgi:hypothetical protein
MTTKNKRSLADAMSQAKIPLNNNITQNNKASEVEEKKVIVCVKPEVHYQLKKLALETGTNIKTLGNEALNDLFIKHNIPIK